MEQSEGSPADSPLGREGSLLVSSADRALWRKLTDCLPEFHLDFAETAEEAELKLFEGHVEVLIFDVSINGAFTEKSLKVIRKIRPHIPAIVLLEEAHEKEGRKLLELGIFYLMPKPVSLATLKTLIVSALEKSRNARRYA